MPVQKKKELKKKEMNEREAVKNENKVCKKCPRTQ